MGGGGRQLNPLALVKRFTRPVIIAVTHILFPRSLRTKPDVVGVILELRFLTEAIGRCELTVQSVTRRATETFKATVTKETVVLRLTPERRRRVDYRHLSAGQEVHIWFPATTHLEHWRHGAVQQIAIMGEKQGGQ